MKRSTFLLTALLSVSAILASAPAGAQATRTWVSGVGNDANPCSRTAPCKTFAGAISKTAVGGEIDALDPGGYGAVTITKSITIDGGGGQVASILASGTNGIIVSGAGVVVTLRNLRINGIAQAVSPVLPGLNGIRLLNGAVLHVENCVIFGFSQNAIDVALNQATGAKVFVTDTILSNSAGGITARNTGSGVVILTVQRGSLVQNSSFGLRADGSGAGLIAASLSDSYASGNGTGVLAAAGPSGANILVTRSSVTANVTNGLQASGASNILVSNTLVTFNGTGLAVSGGGSIQTYKNNAVDGNGTNGAFTGSIIPE